MSFFEIGDFECYDANVIMCDRVGKYAKVMFELWCNMRK
jgi:hypothetical protein